MTKTTKTWTPERRAAARERILKNKPWEKSTGPRTRRGKAASSRNAFTHGMYSETARRFYKLLNDQSAFLRDLRMIRGILREHEQNIRTDIMK